MNRFILFICVALFSSSTIAVTLAQTTASALNVRSEPNGKVLFSLPKDSIVGVTAVQESWTKIIYLPENDINNAQFGWVNNAYLKVVATENSSNSSSSYTVSGDDCEYEYDSNSEVCVSARDADLDCKESLSGSYYRTCEIEVEYDIATNYEGDDYLDVDVECEVEIKYKEKESYLWSNDSDSESENHSLYYSGSESGDMDFDFTFSSFKEVINVKIGSVECEIKGVYKW